MRLCECGSSTRPYTAPRWGWRKWCRACEKRRYNEQDNTYRQYKEAVCCACGFIPVDMCQLDVDHIDGDHANDHPSNLQTLCSNCHRLKTHKKGPYL